MTAPTSHADTQPRARRRRPWLVISAATVSVVALLAAAVEPSVGVNFTTPAPTLATRGAAGGATTTVPNAGVSTDQSAGAATTTTRPPLSGPPLTLRPPPAAQPPPPPTAAPTTAPPGGAPDSGGPGPGAGVPEPTAPPGSTPPGGEGGGGEAGGDDSTTTTLPTGEPDGSPVNPVPPAAEGVATTPDGSEPAKEPPRLGDDQVADILASLERSGANSTGALLDALRPLVGLGIAPSDAALLGMGRFPVAGPATFRDDWHDPRSTPTPHLHKGNDIFAAFGTPARAPVEGTVRFAEEGAGGRAAYVTAADGTWYYLAHLESFSPELKTGDKVTQGTVVGFVGDSGNARGGAPHVHFEVHPLGGEAVNPKPILDTWLAEALAAAPALVATFTPPEQRVLSATNELRQLEVAIPGGAPPSASVLMWASTVSAGGGTVRLAEAAAARAASHIDWWQVELAAQARDSLTRQAKDNAYNLIAPLTNKALAPLLGSGS